MRKEYLNAKLTVLFFREDKNTIIASCPTLDISTCGSTLEEARSNFSEMFELFVEEAMNMGTLDKILASCGWKKGKDHYTLPTLIDTETEDVKIPCLN
jgi:predicted RNase H-like HicB family nuclease